MLNGRPQLVPDVSKDRDYIEYSPEIRSELAVPLFDGDRGKVIGVLNVESDQVDAFDEDDREALLALAELAVIAIQNTWRVEALRTQTHLALIGLGTAVGRHELAGLVGQLRTEVFILEKVLRNPEPEKEELAEGLANIEQLLKKLAVERPTEPVDEGIRSILVNEELIAAFEKRFLERRPGWRQRFDIEYGLAPGARIRVNPQWLFRALEILVNNAAQAGASKITLGSRLKLGRDTWAEIYVADNGSGIPEEVRPRLLREPIREGSKGLGTGLLIAQAVVRIYGGSVHWEDRKPQGTTTVISLPLDRNPEEVEAKSMGPAEEISK